MIARNHASLVSVSVELFVRDRHGAAELSLADIDFRFSHSVAVSRVSPFGGDEEEEEEEAGGIPRNGQSAVPRIIDPRKCEKKETRWKRIERNATAKRPG